MYLELSIKDGDGYISTFSDNGVSMVCKQVGVGEMKSLLKELLKNTTLSIQENSNKDWFIVREHSQLNVNEQITIENTGQESFNKTGKIHYQDKSKVEFYRFKQDCRKRALDLAHSESINSVAASQANKGVNVLDLADKYYEWLTKEV